MKMVATLFLMLALWVPRPALAACSVSTSALPFGNYNPLALTPQDAVGQVSVQCSFLLSLLTTYTLKLSAGGSGQYSNRTMSSGGSTLNYNLYQDALRLIVWGNGTGGSGLVSHTQLIGVGGYTGNHPVYGRLPAQQNVAPGTYSDTIVVTLEY